MAIAKLLSNAARAKLTKAGYKPGVAIRSYERSARIIRAQAA